MQQQMEQIQAQLALRTVEATSGGGAVKVTAKCDGSIASIKIDPAALKEFRMPEKQLFWKLFVTDRLLQTLISTRQWIRA